MKLLFSGYHNPHFVTVTEYAEGAARALGHTLEVFDNRSFLLPGRIREVFPPFQQWDLARLNRKLVAVARAFRPDVFLEIGGDRILPQTVRALREGGIKTALWTTDPPQHPDIPLFTNAGAYDFIFCAGSETQEMLSERGRKDARLLPFACDPRVHAPVVVSGADAARYQADIVFVGSVHPGLYPGRVKILESIADLNLGVWGPGSETILAGSALKRNVRGEAITPQEWVRVYSAAKIVLCMHYRDPRGRMPCHQASTRVFEALACKCFLLTDRQRDVESLFADGKHLAVFQDAADLRKKIGYYLEHDEQRTRIAEAGYAEVLQKHTYVHRIRELLNTINAAHG